MAVYGCSRALTTAVVAVTVAVRDVSGVSASEAGSPTNSGDAGDPRVLLLDEPVNGLDPDGVAWIRALLQSLAAQGRTVLVSSHPISERALTADHLIAIGRGRLIADASVQEVVRHGLRG